MVADNSWIPESVPLDRPSAARMYDYFLGGAHNFAVDRAAAARAIAIYPDFPFIMQANRAFLRRVVQFLVQQGIRQFLDIGSGIPTVGNVHEIAQRLSSDARVVYVDVDPIAVAHSEAMLAGNPNAAIVQVDARNTSALLRHPTVQHLLDFSQPVAILVVFLLHFIADDGEAERMIETLREALPRDGYLVLSHGSADEFPGEVAPMLELYRQTPTPWRSRSRREFERFFAGFDLIAPGVVETPLWRPETADDLYLNDPARACSFAGVGRKS